jgi:energy-converting hydrogenase Eha subunit H
VKGTLKVLTWHPLYEPFLDLTFRWGRGVTRAQTATMAVQNLRQVMQKAGLLREKELSAHVAVGHAGAVPPFFLCVVGFARDEVRCLSGVGILCWFGV